MKKKNKILSATFARRIALMTVCIIGLVGTMRAQQTEATETVKRTQWGVKVAMNIASLHFDASKGESVSSKSFVGGAAGLTFTYAFDSHWRIHSGVELSLKGFTADETGGSHTLTAKAAYVQVPVAGGYALEFSKWTFEPRMGAFFAYGVAGNYSVSGGGESKQTFGEAVARLPTRGAAATATSDRVPVSVSLVGNFISQSYKKFGSNPRKDHLFSLDYHLRW